MPEWDRHNMSTFLKLAETNLDAAAEYIRQ
jgi:hypothetical protein